MNQLSFPTPCGMLTVRGDDCALVEVFWGDAKRNDPTPLLTEARDQLTAYFAGDRRDFSLPTAPLGTDFQRRAWAEIARVGFGETATYGGLAAVLSSGPRAVAGACARNRIPLIIPCHRVIAAGGQLGGYSGGKGLDTKRSLLRLEGSLAGIR